MLTQEREILKAKYVVEEMVELVLAAGEEGPRIDEVERALFDKAMQVGQHMLKAFVAQQGSGDAGKKIERQGTILRRSKKKRSRRYVSIFGELTVKRFVYAKREGQKALWVPLDAQLGMPAGEFSYVLEDWQQKLAVKDPFGEAIESLHDWLGIKLSVRTAEEMNRRMAQHADHFRASQSPPDPESEGEVLVVSADGKGVPMRRPLEERIRAIAKKTARGRPRKEKPEKSPRKRLGRGEKRTKKQMAYVGAVYSMDPEPRTVEDILDEVSRRESKRRRPKPKNKRMHVQMTQILEGEVIKGMPRLFAELAVERHQRDPESEKTVVCLMDGDPNLWEMQRTWFEDAVCILDLYHVMERLWTAAYVFHKERSMEAEQFVNHYLTMLLEGKVGYLIRSLKQKLPHGAKRKKLVEVITYLENNRQYMKYHDYLAAGYPIGSGVIEGACRYVVKDRMERTGMRWEIEGASSMLHLRSLYLNRDWHAFVNYRIEREQEAMYGQAA